MIVIIILFYCSLAVVVAMVIKKLFEIRELKLSVIEGIEKEFQGKLYELVHDFWYDFRIKILARSRVIAIQTLRIVEHAVIGFIIKVGDRLRKRHRKLYDMVKGKGVIKNKGSVSFFLKEVSEYKNGEVSKE